MKTKIILFLLLAAAALSAVFLLGRKETTPSPVARITQYGAVLEEIELDKVEAPYTLTFEDGSGRNVVTVEKGRIRVSEADCPDQICVYQGWISDSALPIICLPHRLVVEIVGDGGELDGGAG